MQTKSAYRLLSTHRIEPELIDADGFLRTFPHRHGTDGFFAAALERVDAPKGA